MRTMFETADGHLRVEVGQHETTTWLTIRSHGGSAVDIYAGSLAEIRALGQSIVDAALAKMPRPTIAELEAILARDDAPAERMASAGLFVAPVGGISRRF